MELTGTEFELLHLLARESGRVFSRDDILNQLRGHEADLYTRAVDIVVSRLRKKLEPLDCIKTLRNAGYSLALRRVGTDAAMNWLRRLRHSIKLRLLAVFLLLALSVAFIFISGAQKAFSLGWREAARPLLMDYVSRLAADVAPAGTPEVRARAGHRVCACR